MELDISDIKVTDIYARVFNTPGRKPHKASNKMSWLKNKQSAPGGSWQNVTKEENELSIQTHADFLPSICTSFDMSPIDTPSNSYQEPQITMKIEKTEPLPSPKKENENPNQSICDINDIVKSEVIDDKSEIDVCKQFLNEDKIKTDKSIDLDVDTKNQCALQVFDSIDTNKNSYFNDDANISFDKSDSISISGMNVSANGQITAPSALLESPILSDLKKEKHSQDTLFKGNVQNLSFSDKSLKTDALTYLDGIDIMRLPVDLDDSSHIDILDNIDIDMKTEMLQETQSCFLSLVRHIFCSTPDHRTTLENLQQKINGWATNPITALNDWYGYAENWLDMLESAINFLSGEFVDQPEDFVPYIEYKPNLNIYQWIGAGRDSDQNLKPLCEFWLKRRTELESKQKENPLLESNLLKSCAIELEEGQLVQRSNSFERLASPPPSRFPTVWTVQKATQSEIVEFRKQERKRFDNPHRSFTYRMNGFESVVGPVKGIYAHIPALTKARGHSMLTTDRPSFVTILTLVRDAAARLPNGNLQNYYFNLNYQ